MKKPKEHPLKKWGKRPPPKTVRIKAKAEEKDLEHLTLLGKKEYYAGEVASCKQINVTRARDSD